MSASNSLSASAQGTSRPAQTETWQQPFREEPNAGSQNQPRPTRFNYSTVIAIILDYLSIIAGVAAGLLVYQLCRGLWVSNELVKLFAFSLQYGMAFVLFGRMHYLYSYGHSLLQVRETAGILRVSVYSLVLLSVALFFSQIVVPRLLLLLSWLFVTFFVLLQKHLTRKMLASRKAAHPADRRVLIIGTGSDARRVFSFLLNSPDLQLRPVAFLHEQNDSASVIYTHDYNFRDYAPVYVRSLDQDLIAELGISNIFVADTGLSPQRIAELQSLACDHSVQLSFVGAMQTHFAGHLLSIQEMDGLLVSSFAQETKGKSIYDICKRTVDIAGSLFIISACAPVFAAAAAWIKLTSKGPVLFRQERIGHGGKPFEIYKFRSMYTTALKYARSPEDGADPRITSAGRFLRRTSLDELPQLFNVLVGEMTLVGPRPEMPYVVSQYNSHQKRRLDVKPGLTGLWQLSADRRFAIHECIEYDLYYIQHRGLFLDLAILLHTFAFAMRGI